VPRPGLRGAALSATSPVAVDHLQHLWPPRIPPRGWDGGAASVRLSVRWVPAAMGFRGWLLCGKARCPRPPPRLGDAPRGGAASAGTRASQLEPLGEQGCRRRPLPHRPPAAFLPALLPKSGAGEKSPACTGAVSPGTPVRAGSPAVPVGWGHSGVPWQGFSAPQGELGLPGAVWALSQGAGARRRIWAAITNKPRHRQPGSILRLRGSASGPRLFPSPGGGQISAARVGDDGREEGGGS